MSARRSNHVSHTTHGAAHQAWEEVRIRTTNVIQNAGPGFVFGLAPLISFILFSVFTKSNITITITACGKRTEVCKECDVTEEGDERQEGSQPRGESSKKHDGHVRNEAHDKRSKCRHSSCKSINACECGY